MTERSIKGSKYKNGHISAITYGTSKYKNVSLSHKTYSNLELLRNSLDPNLKLSRSQTVTYLVNEKLKKLNGKAERKNHGKSNT